MIGTIGCNRAIDVTSCVGRVNSSLPRTCKSGIAAFAVVVDAKDDRAVAFYEHYGFQRFKEMERSLFLPIGDALKRHIEARP